MLKLERLKELLSYDPETGVFVWAVNRRGHARKGMKAGCVGKDGYILIRVDGRLYPAHQLAWLYMTGECPVHEIDHENNIRRDNSWDNLRKATSTEQKQNSSLRRDNTSGRKGVFQVNNRWRAVIWVNKTPTHLGYYETKDEAFEAYKHAAHKHFGEFANPCAT